MLFSLEILQAAHGDCLILHYGTTDAPKIIVIDGGPSGIYNRYLKPRLLSIKETLSDRRPLPLEMVMVSHADDDHINGIKMLTNDLIREIDNGVIDDERLFKVKKLWFNAFDDIIGNNEIPVVSSLSSDTNLASLEAAGKSHIAALVASTAQGRTIRENAYKLQLTLNSGFAPIEVGKSLLVRGDISTASYQDDELKIKVVHPNAQRLRELQAKWDIDLQKYKDDGDESIILASLASLDKSPFNLSSIVCVAELGEKRILLTGDARSDDILSGLEANGFLDGNGKAHFDILKMPHHGSDANMKPDFLQAITADHYIVSADGKHHNPDETTLNMMAENVGTGTVYFTNHDGEFDLGAKMDAFAQKIQQTGSRLTPSYPSTPNTATLINLFDQLTY